MLDSEAEDKDEDNGEEEEDEDEEGCEFISRCSDTVDVIFKHRFFTKN